MAATSTPTAKRSPRRLMLLAGVVAALCLVGGAIAVYFGIANPTIPTGPPSTAARGFLNDLQTQSYHDAYTYLCGTMQASVTEDEFVTQLKAGHALDSYHIDGVDTKKVDNVPSATVTVTVTRQGGAVTHETVLLREPGDTWQVCGGSIMASSTSG